MKYSMTGAQAKELDRYTTGQIGIPSVVLMERAALAVADAVCSLRPEPGIVWIACGTGNNGADGIAAGRILKERGYDVTVLLAGDLERATEEHRLQQKIAGMLKVRMVPAAAFTWGHCDVLVDALFGIGLGREITGAYRELMERLRKQEKAQVVAVDIPSGIHADTGEVMGAALKADVTVTFGFYKNGLILYPGRSYAGEVRIADIGFSVESLVKTGWSGRVPESSDLERLPGRRADGNKGTFGKVLLIAGCAGMSGAAYLSALAAYRLGAGLVRILTVPENRAVLQDQLPEAIVTVYDPRWLCREEEAGSAGGNGKAGSAPAGENGKEGSAPVGENGKAGSALAGEKRFENLIEEQCEWADVIVMGPGLGQAPYVERLVETVLSCSYVPMVLDADGLNAVAAHPRLQQYFTENIIITPHIGEMARLTKKTPEEIKTDPVTTARDYSADMNVVCVLKDASTVTADKDGTVYINTSGCSAMAKAGSGDVLTGVIAALLAQGMEETEAAAFGVYLHGLAGEAAARDKGCHGVLAHEIADYLSFVR